MSKDNTNLLDYIKQDKGLLKILGNDLKRLNTDPASLHTFGTMLHEYLLTLNSIPLNLPFYQFCINKLQLNLDNYIASRKRPRQGVKEGFEERMKMINGWIDREKEYLELKVIIEPIVRQYKPDYSSQVLRSMTFSFKEEYDKLKLYKEDFPERFDIEFEHKIDRYKEIIKSSKDEYFRAVKNSSIDLEFRKKDYEKTKNHLSIFIDAFNLFFSEDETEIEGELSADLKVNVDGPTTFEDLFYNPDDIDLTFTAMRELRIVNDANVWIYGDKKAAIMAIIHSLDARGKIKDFKDSTRGQLFAKKIETTISDRRTRKKFPYYYKDLMVELKTLIG